MQKQEYFVQRIGWKVADRSSEQVGFCLTECFEDICLAQRPGVPQPQYLQEERTGNGGFQTVQTVNAPIQFCRTGGDNIRLSQPAIPFGVSEHILQNILCSLPIPLSLLPEIFKAGIDIFQVGYHLLLDAEIIPNKGTDIVARILLDFVPILRVIDFLFMERKSHQDVITNLISFAQCKTGGVQAFKNKLRVVLVVQGNIDDLQFADCAVKSVDGNLLPLDTVTEIAVVNGQVGLHDLFGISVKQTDKRPLIVFNWLELDFLTVVFKFIDQIFFEQQRGQIFLLSLHCSLLQQTVYRKHQQGNRGKPLLAINNQVIHHLPAWVADRNNAAEEVAVQTFPRN